MAFRADTRYGPFRIGGRTVRAIPYGFLKFLYPIWHKRLNQG